MEYVSIKTVIADLLTTVSDKVINIDDVIQWASSALGQIAVYESLEMQVSMIQVKDYESWLPKGTLQVNQLAYKEGKLISKPELKELKEDAYQFTSFRSKYFDNYHKGWKPMKASTDNFMLSVMCPNSPNLNCNCDKEFIIYPNGKIVTTLKEGYILISYMRAPLDEEGYFLIPNNDDLIQALRTFIMARMWERRWNMKEEGAEQRFSYYVKDWGLKKNQVRGALKLPNEGQMYNIIDNAYSLLPKSKRHFRFFGSFGNKDKTFF